MALVVFLRGVNVGGFRNFRPALLAAELGHLDAINIGATGVFVVRKPLSQARLRNEIARRLPFDAHIAICSGRQILDLVSQNFFARHRARRDVIRFVSIPSRPRRSAPQLPLTLPPRGTWYVKVLAHHGPFLVGTYRREMKSIRYLGELDAIYGVPITTRSWSTIAAVARVLDDKSPDSDDQ